MAVCIIPSTNSVHTPALAGGGAKDEQTVASRLAAVLKHDGISTSYAAAQCGVSRSTICRVLGGKRFQTRTIMKLTRGLEISAGWLLFGGLENVGDRRSLEIHYWMQWPNEPGRVASMMRFIDVLRTLPDSEIAPLRRMGIRLLNKDRKVQRLIEMRERGQISRAQLLLMM
ncbi:MAG: helix-turn-helix domain-containing protein [Pseudomonadota bacterium]